MTTHPLPKPRVRSLGEQRYRVDFGFGRTAEIRPASDGDGWIYELPDDVGRRTWGAQGAIAEAWMHCIDAPAPVKIDPVELAAMIRAAEGNVTLAAKLLKRLLKLRTGISWSVTGGRGTARSWLQIDAPKARLVDSDGLPTDKSWGYMGAPDRALLGVILGRLPHHQGESIRPGRGVRSWYLWQIAGHAAPEDLRVEPRNYD